MKCNLEVLIYFCKINSKILTKRKQIIRELSQ